MRYCIDLQSLTCIINGNTTDVFQAIADPTRRKILNVLAGKSLNLNSIAGNFDLSRQAISLPISISNSQTQYPILRLEGCFRCDPQQ